MRREYRAVRATRTHSGQTCPPRTPGASFRFPRAPRATAARIRRLRPPPRTTAHRAECQCRRREAPAITAAEARRPGRRAVDPTPCVRAFFVRTRRDVSTGVRTAARCQPPARPTAKALAPTATPETRALPAAPRV